MARPVVTVAPAARAVPVAPDRVRTTVVVAVSVVVAVLPVAVL
jgi:hypothetical protein